jgi:DNA ligase (NAD+)
MNFKQGNHKTWAYSVDLDELHAIILKANDKYYNSSNTMFSDEIYDDILDIYNSKTDNKYNDIGSEPEGSNNDKVKLPYHMGSMNKTYSISAFNSWLEKTACDSYVITPKIDGTSCLISITPSRVDIYSRGNGEVGKNLTHLHPYILSKSNLTKVQTYIKQNNLRRFVCRGELIISKTTFSVFSSQFKSARSMINGISNQKATKDTSSLDSIEFMLFDILEPRKIPEHQFKLASILDFKVVKPFKITFSKLKEENANVENSILLTTLKELRASYDYDIDGIIITKNILNPKCVSGNPDYSIAFKSNGDGEITTVINIEWNISKHGTLIPTIVFKPIKLGSSVVSRCTGFNGAYIFNNSLGPNSIIRVLLSGEVIPYISQVIEQASIPQMPQVKYKWNESRVNCEIMDACEELELKKIVNFIKNIGIDNISIGMVRHLFTHKFTTLKQILTITPEQLLMLPRIEEKMATKIVNSINIVINNPIELAKIMDGSLCFGNGFGEKRCSQLVSKYPDFLDSLPTKEELNSLPGWSNKSNEKLYKGIPKFKDFLEENDYIIIADTHFVAEDYGEIASLDIKKICITGKRDPTILTFIKDHHIELVTSLTNETDMLVCYDKQVKSGKLDSAIKKQIPILSIEEFKVKYKIE